MILSRKPLTPAEDKPPFGMTLAYKSSITANMKNNLLRLSASFLLLVLLTLFIPGCAVIGGIFKAGV
jgi:hypothetical protein